MLSHSTYWILLYLHLFMMGKVYYKKKNFCEYVYTLKKLQARNKNGSTLGKPFSDNFNNFTKVLPQKSDCLPQYFQFCFYLYFGTRLESYFLLLINITLKEMFVSKIMIVISLDVLTCCCFSLFLSSCNM